MREATDEGRRQVRATASMWRSSFRRFGLRRLQTCALIKPPSRSTGLSSGLLGGSSKSLRLAGRHLVDRPTLQDRWGKAKITYLRPDTTTVSNFTDDDISNAQNTVWTELLDRGQVPEPLVRRLLPLRAPIGLAREGVNVRLMD